MSPDKLIELRMHGVNVQYVEHAGKLLRATEKEVSPGKIIWMKIHNL